MKTKRIDLDIDFIGGQGSLTKEEELSLSDYFKQKKLVSKRSVQVRHSRTTKRQHAHV
jgi:hypothetical protein